MNTVIRTAAIIFSLSLFTSTVLSGSASADGTAIINGVYRNSICIQLGNANYHHLALNGRATKAVLGFDSFCSPEDASRFRAEYIRQNLPYVFELLVPALLFYGFYLVWTRAKLKDKKTEGE
jgi:hypothetical protein